MARDLPTARRKGGYTDAGASTPKPTPTQQKQIDRYEADDRSKSIMAQGANRARHMHEQNEANGGNPSGPYHKLLKALGGK